MTIFRDRLRELRVSKGFTEYQLAEKCGFIPETIICYENKNVGPNAGETIKLCEALECSSDYLFGFSEDVGMISIKEREALEMLHKQHKNIDMVEMTKSIDENLIFRIIKKLGASELVGDVLHKIYKIKNK